MRIPVRVKVRVRVREGIRVRARVRVRVRDMLITINFTNRMVVRFKIRRFMMEICGFRSREGNDGKGKFTIF